MQRDETTNAPAAARVSRVGEKSDEVKILGETAGGYIVDADGWSFESCPGCGTLVGEWLTEDGPDVMLLVECPMCVEASRDEPAAGSHDYDGGRDERLAEGDGRDGCVAAGTREVGASARQAASAAPVAPAAWCSPSSTTMDLTTDSFLLNVARDENGGWIVSEHETTAYGAGPTLFEALTDFHAALRSHLAVMDGDTITPRLQRQKARIIWMLERAK